MGFLVSPGVEVKEIDLTNVVPAVSTSIGGFAGRFKWGPVGELVTVSSENDLALLFGKPDATHAQSFLQAASFLKYGNALKISRVVDLDGSSDSPAVATSLSGKVGVASDSTKYSVKNREDYDTTTVAVQNVAIARCIGAMGNSLRVIIARSSGLSAIAEENATVAAARVLMKNNFDNDPGNVSAETATVKDEIHVLVLDEDGLFTGQKNEVLEKYQGLSLCSDATKDDGSSNYYYDVINQQSQYIFINKLGDTAGLYPAADKTVAAATAITSIDDITNVFANDLFTGSLASGADGTLGAGDYTADDTGLGLFADSETVDVNLLFVEAGQLTDGDQKLVDNEVISIAQTRKDAVAFISAPVDSSNGLQHQTSEANKLSKVTTRRNDVTNYNNSYAFMDSSPLYVYNKYNDNYVYIAASGHMAGLCANTDNVADAWFSPAGYNRGNLRSVTKLAYNPNQASRDTLYKAQINPIVSFPGQGILLFGDKTGQTKPSAFDRINVRRLFIVLEKAIATASKFQLFELNDEFTRAQFRNLIEPFLRDVKGRRGITDFLVVCDETNNTGQVIDTNRFVADIYIKPARSINFISLNFVATRTGVDFSEVVSG